MVLYGRPNSKGSYARASAQHERFSAARGCRASCSRGICTGYNASGACGANIACDSSTRTNARGRAQTAGRAAAFCRNTDRNRRRPRFQREYNRRRPKLYAHPFAHRFAQLSMGVGRAP